MHTPPGMGLPQQFFTDHRKLAKNSVYFGLYYKPKYTEFRGL